MNPLSVTRRGLLATLFAAWVLTSTALQADILYLKSGKTLEGRVTHNPQKGTYTVEQPTGVVEIPQSQVARLERGKAPVDVFEERFSKLPPGEIEPLLELAAWAREKRLRDPLQRVCRRIIALDPNDEMARRELGYVVFGNVWVLEKELRKKKGLVKFRDEWMTAAERDRRQREDARQAIGDLFERATSENRWIKRYAVEELIAYRGPHARSLFAEYLRDPRELVRMLAASLLTSFPAQGEERSSDPEAVEVTAQLYKMYLSQRSGKETQTLFLALRHFHPAEAFRLGVDTLRHSEDERELRRARSIVHQLLRKAWVPNLCHAVVSETKEVGGRGKSEILRHEAVRELLKEELDVDFGFDVEAWLRWWKANEKRFEDA